MSSSTKNVRAELYVELDAFRSDCGHIETSKVSSFAELFRFLASVLEQNVDFSYIDIYVDDKLMYLIRDNSIDNDWEIINLDE